MLLVVSLQNTMSQRTRPLEIQASWYLSRCKKHFVIVHIILYFLSIALIEIGTKKGTLAPLKLYLRVISNITELY